MNEWKKQRKKIERKKKRKREKVRKKWEAISEQAIIYTKIHHSSLSKINSPTKCIFGVIFGGYVQNLAIEQSPCIVV